MANVPATINDMPKHLQAYRRDNFNERFAVPAGDPIGLLSIKGKVFTARYQGETEVIKSSKGRAMPFLDVVIIDAHPNTSKTFWLKGYNASSDSPPDCSSLDGVTPDPRSPHKQATKCNGCKHNVFGTAENGKGKRCGDGKRVAVLPAHDLENTDWGGPMLLRIPPTSFKAFGKYAKQMDAEGRDLNLIVTRLVFVAESEHPQLAFEPGRWLSEEEAPLMQQWLDSEHLHRVLMISPVELHDDKDDEPAEEVEEDVVPAKRVSNTAAEKVAAAKVATKPKTTEVGLGRKPRKAPVVEVDEPEEEVKPVKRATATVVPLKTVTAAVAKPTRVKASEPELTPNELKKKKLQEMIAAAEALAAEVEDDDEPSAPEEALTIEGEAEEVDEGDMSTEDLLGAIDDELDADVPD